MSRPFQGDLPLLLCTGKRLGLQQLHGMEGKLFCPVCSVIVKLGVNCASLVLDVQGICIRKKTYTTH